MDKLLSETNSPEGQTIRNAVADWAEACRQIVFERDATIEQVEQLCPAEKVARGLKALDTRLAGLPELERRAIRTAFNEVIDHAVAGGLQACAGYRHRVEVP